ncbi:hypothetical protein ONZ45_g11498 [Pleurotus djamor]|nr:hypothetical protein ONZ45_g11498 [Pleurotus djamor]
MSMEESISLEETNKIRISLGLKPLTEDKEPADSKEKQAEDNYAKKREQEAKEKETKRIADQIAKVRNRRELNASLKGATLGDADGDDNTLKWIKRSKKKEKELAKKRLEELENMDKQFQEEYSERKSLATHARCVSHDFEDLGEGDARILTLKDSRILDNEEDELQNVEMAEEERTKERNETKIKRRDYTGYDDDEFTAGNAGMKRAILAKYDEDLGLSNKETGFRLGSSTLPSKAEQTAKREQEAAASVNKSLLSIDYAKNLEMTDYLQEGDVGFKKPKTKKKRSNRRAADAELAPEDAMEVDVKPRERNLNDNFVDDDELQAMLARSRKAKIHKPKKLSPEELAKKIARERTQDPSEPTFIKVEEDAADADDGNRLTFDDTSEFVRAVGNNPVPVKTEPVEASTQPTRGRSVKSPSRDVSMAPADQPMEEIEAGEVVVKDEDEEDDMAMLDAIEEALKVADAQELEEDDTVGTSAEPTFSTGMASTLNILRQQGILATPAAGQVEREQTQLRRDQWLAEQRYRIAQREVERLQARGGNKDQTQREYENRLREQQEARDNLDAFKNYKPDVEIKYYDEFGRSLTPKEAWKALSHKFHGKGSGRMKTEKRLKKIAEEKKKEAMASGDTPLSMSKAFQQRQEKTGQAHFVLSVGNRGAVPQIAEFLDSQPLAKGKTEKKKQKKSDAKASQNGFMTVPAPVQHIHSIDSPASSSGANGSPAPRPGFSRISSTAVVEPSSQGGTPVPSDRTKVAFGFSAKRKAGEEGGDAPPTKRR